MDDGEVGVPGLESSSMVVRGDIKARVTYGSILRPGGQQAGKGQYCEKSVKIFHIEIFSTLIYASEKSNVGYST